jgi:hypothetical protein
MKGVNHSAALLSQLFSWNGLRATLGEKHKGISTRHFIEANLRSKYALNDFTTERSYRIPLIKYNI